MTESREQLMLLARLDARLHDPIEKSLILMRTPEGHERGTSATLRRRLGLEDLPEAVRQAVKTADRWASAADRAAFPKRDTDGRYPGWQTVRFNEDPLIIHPLTGDRFSLGASTIEPISPDQAKALAASHLEALVVDGDLRKTALAFWRFGPELDAPEVRSIWATLPADTRTPDHTIHDHLDLTAALAGCLAADDEGVAMLSLAIGPVQEFIAAARSTSDLWAGSHLLSRITWEAMRLLCEEFGPESILFPRLRGLPQVDLWLQEECGLSSELFSTLSWRTLKSDANPLFAAALPNRFTALVPASQAESAARKIKAHLERWVLEKAEQAWRMVLVDAGIKDDPEFPAYRQIRDQLSDFPEVHWVAVPWKLAQSDSKGLVDGDCAELEAALAMFHESSPPGFLGSPTWASMSGGFEHEGTVFWRPNVGSLYPAFHELAERSLGAVKSIRAFTQSGADGWRDTMTGEFEWLTTDREHLFKAPGSRTDTVWAQIKRHSWVKRGEHLSALGTLKRLWPSIFVQELRGVLDTDLSRFVVSSHTMALGASLVDAVRSKQALPDDLREQLQASLSETRDRAALPMKLIKEIREHPDKALIRHIPVWFEQRFDVSEEEGDQASKMLRSYLGKSPEAYFGLMLFDGDHMGAWLSAAPELTLPYQDSWHPQIRANVAAMAVNDALKSFMLTKRAPSPSRHMAISEALNHFSLQLAPHIIEERFFGRVLYAGGDDVMAMTSVADLIPAAASLRAAYSGVEPSQVGLSESDLGFQRQANGFVYHKKRLMRLMGERATASAGLVIAHHQAPLSALLRELRHAERRAKSGGRNRFSLSVVKRSGGALTLTAQWGEPVRLLIALRDFLGAEDVSRRAAYNAVQWIRDLPCPGKDPSLATSLMAFQFARQSDEFGNEDKCWALASSLVEVANQEATAAEASRLDWIENFISVAEFLARETRFRPNANTTLRKEHLA